MSFTHLNVSSAYSFHFGTAKPDELARAARSLGFDALAITDLNGLYGAVKHIGACLKQNIQPIVGVRLSVQNKGTVTIIARGNNNGAGWAALCRIISAAQKKSKKEVAISQKDLAALMATENKDNCTIFSTCG
jgi:error-prone DNA polymerase